MLCDKTLFARDIQEKQDVSAQFLVKFSAVAVGKNGKPYMNLVLQDKSGEIEARIWERAEQFAGQAVKDAYVHVKGRCQLFQNRRQLVIAELQVLREDEVNPKEYVAAGEQDSGALHERVLALVASMADPHYRALAESILKDDAEIVELLKKAPAAKSIHHAYRGGLIAHIVSVVGLLDKVATHYGPKVDRDLLFLGGFLHDICKVWELSYERVTDYTLEGRLVGHLVMGVELVERKIRELESQPGRLPSPFPVDKRLLVKHVLLAHHGELEYGSPKRPKCVEALIVHYVDDLDSKVASILDFIQQDQTPGRFTALHRNLERYFYKPDWALSQPK